MTGHVTHSEAVSNAHVTQFEPMRKECLGKSCIALTSEIPKGIFSLFAHGINEERVGSNIPPKPSYACERSSVMVSCPASRVQKEKTVLEIKT